MLITKCSRIQRFGLLLFSKCVIWESQIGKLLFPFLFRYTVSLPFFKKIPLRNMWNHLQFPLFFLSVSSGVCKIQLKLNFIFKAYGSMHTIIVQVCHCVQLFLFFQNFLDCSLQRFFLPWEVVDVFLPLFILASQEHFKRISFYECQ